MGTYPILNNISWMGTFCYSTLTIKQRNLDNKLYKPHSPNIKWYIVILDRQWIWRYWTVPRTIQEKITTTMIERAYAVSDTISIYHSKFFQIPLKKDSPLLVQSISDGYNMLEQQKNLSKENKWKHFWKLQKSQHFSNLHTTKKTHKK